MYLLGFLAGIVLGILFFGGLYVSVKVMAGHKHPAFYMLLATTVRMFVLLLGFYLLSSYGFVVMLFALLGVMLVRFYMVWRQKRQLALDQREEVDDEH